MKKYYILTLIILAVTCLFSASPVVDNIIVTPESERVVINYDLAADGQCQVMVLVSADGGANYNIYPSALSGDVGNSVSPGSKQIIWNYHADNIGAGTQYKIKIIARDNQVDTINEFGTFIRVEGGTFFNNVSDITISDFYISKYEVSQAEYEAVMNDVPVMQYGINDTYPVYAITWYNAIKYCNIRSMQEGLIPCFNYNNEGTNPFEWSSSWDNDNNQDINYVCDFNANGYRLLTEMEWMYAAKGGNQQPASGYNQWAGTNVESLLINYAWFGSNSNDMVHTIGTKLPNQLGIYDMSGNVYEGCWDNYEPYSNSNQTDPTGSYRGIYRVDAGGCWYNQPNSFIIGSRGAASPSNTIWDIGFRLARRAE